MLNQKSIATPQLRAKLATAQKVFLSFEGPEVAAIIAALEFINDAVKAGILDAVERESEEVINTNNTALQKIADAFDDEQTVKRMAKLLNSYTNENF